MVQLLTLFQGEGGGSGSGRHVPEVTGSVSSWRSRTPVGLAPKCTVQCSAIQLPAVLHTRTQTREAEELPKFRECLHSLTEHGLYYLTSLLLHSFHARPPLACLFIGFRQIYSKVLKDRYQWPRAPDRILVSPPQKKFIS